MAVCTGCRTVFPNTGYFCPQCGSPLATQVLDASMAPGARVDMGWGQVLVEQRIGDGGMGVVFRGWLYYNPVGPFAGNAPHPVAIKVLHPLLTARASVRRLFVGEATALRRLSHPNIVRFYELIESPKQLALVIEYVDGEALDRVIDRNYQPAAGHGIPCLPFARAWFYFEQLLGSLAATHQLGIVHRDIKPANVLVRRDGFCKLTDFGIARLPADVARLSGGMQPGTGAYMSPEQVLGRDLDGRSDLYGAAILLFEMLTGVTPFQHVQGGELMVRSAQVEDSPPALTKFVPQAPPILDLLFARALAKSPEHRFQSAIELGNVFRNALGLPVTSGWQAQQAFAHQATGLATPFSRTGQPATKLLPEPEAAAIRQAVLDAYRP